jgi:type VI secretion system protein
MTLVLSVRGMDRLDNGEAARLVLDRHGARIGRSPHADWSLPDPRNYVSSTHCEIDYRDGCYVLVDRSTNGTFLNGATERLAAPHTLTGGDLLQIGHYEVEVSLDGGGVAPAEPAPAAVAPAPPGWNAWGDPQPPARSSDWGSPPAEASPGWAPTPAGGEGWSAPAPRAAISGLGPMSGAWSAPAVAAAPTGPSVWDQPQAASPKPSAWSSAAADASGPPAAVDVWGDLTSSVGVDWARGGFGAAQQAPDPFGLSPSSPPPPGPAQALGLPAEASRDWAQPAPRGWSDPLAVPAAPAPPPGAQLQPSPPPTPLAPRPADWTDGPGSPAVGRDEWSAFVAAAGLAAADVKAPPASALATAGLLLRRMTAGLVVMLEARARAKAQLGAQGTSLEFAGNNPLKFARSPEKALAQMLSPAERGFMAPEAAIEDAFRDLQAHQVATLTAMQGALAATLARFSPSAIRSRAEMRGVLAKILPSARDATLWQAYEREFEGVAKGSDEAFMEVFAKEFRTAYEEVAAKMKQGAGRG